MPVTIYHNPRCSKSRASLALLQDRGIEPEIVAYLETPPAAETILELARLLGVSVADLLRRGESEFKEATDLPALDDDAALADWIADHPKVLQRPIVVSADGTRAAIGRPPENIVEVL